MRFLRNYRGETVRLTEERLAHILEHPEMADMEAAIQGTLEHPECVIQSLSDSEVHLYYRSYQTTPVSQKFVCVVVKARVHDWFVITAYLTDKMKKGGILWPAKL